MCTFAAIFLDPNIEETGQQLFKSNNGPTDCCYDYCKHTDGICSSSCDVIFNDTDTSIIASQQQHNYYSNSNNIHHHHSNSNQTSRLNSLADKSPNIFVKLDDGSYILNDYSYLPADSDIICPAIPNITQSTQQCTNSQAVAAAASSATSVISLSPSSATLSISNLLLQLITHFTTNYLNPSLMEDNYSINCIVALLTSSSKNYWTILVWNLLKFTALTNILLQIATGS